MKPATQMGRYQYLLILVVSVCVASSCSPNPITPPHVLPLLVDNSPTWSPVANVIAYQRYYPSTDGPPGLYTISTVTGVRTLISTQAFADLAYSPNGDELATVSGGAVTVIDMTSGVATRIVATDNIAGQPSFSPDGRSIVYARFGRDPGEPPDSAGMHIVDLSTGVDRALMHNGSYVTGAYPRWCPTDSLIAFSAADGIYLVTPHGGDLVRLTVPPARGSHTNPRWLASGRELFITETTTRRRTLIVSAQTGVSSPWLFYVGEQAALAPLDSAIVFRALDPTSPDTPASTLFTRRLNDATGQSIRQLTSYLPPSALRISPQL